jgi:hypothetical protein
MSRRVGGPRRQRGLDRRLVILDVAYRRHARPKPLDLLADAPLEALAGRERQRLLDDDADPAGDERRHPHDCSAATSDPLPRLDRGLGDDMRRDLHAGHEIAGDDDLAVEHREYLERSIG